LCLPISLSHFSVDISETYEDKLECADLDEYKLAATVEYKQFQNFVSRPKKTQEEIGKWKKKAQDK
jgi:hypothetical protein